jgi:hypothetical protein
MTDAHKRLADILATYTAEIARAQQPSAPPQSHDRQILLPADRQRAATTVVSDTANFGSARWLRSMDE